LRKLGRCGRIRARYCNFLKNIFRKLATTINQRRNVMIILGLSNEEIEKPTITETEEVYVHSENGGALVRKGDKVSPLNENEFLIEYLGQPPYEVKWTGVWRCGRQFCEVKSSNGKTMGINANRLKIAA
jgi:hypothetical protein